MALRYWVGGTNTWNSTIGTKWALTSGGAGGQAVPTTADDVIFDAASGAVTCTVSGSQLALTLTTTGFTGTITGTASPVVNVSGNVTLGSGTTWTLATLRFQANSTFTTNNVTVAAVDCTIASVTVTMVGDLRCAGALTLSNGTLTIGANNVYLQSNFQASGGGTRVLNMGSGTWTANIASSPFWSFAAAGTLTTNVETASIVIAPTAVTVVLTFNGAGLTFNNISFTSSVDSWGCIFTGANTFGVFDLSGLTGNGGIITLPGATTTTITQLVASQTRNTAIVSSSATAATLSVSSDYPDFSNCYVANIAATGAGAEAWGVNMLNGGGNSGIDFYDLKFSATARVG